MRLKVELKDVDSFVQIARAGSLTKAALEANVPKATLSNSIRRLEDALNVQLFLRHSSGLSLTDAGQAYLENCEKIFDSCEYAATAAQSAHGSISGRIRIAASAEFGTSIVGAATRHLALQNPDLDFEVRLYTRESLSVDRIEFDCLIYVGLPSDSGLMCQKIGTVSYGLYASPQLIKKQPNLSRPEELANVPGVEYIRFGVPEPWQVVHNDRPQEIEFRRRFRVNDYWTAKHYAVYGDAFVYLPDFFVHYEVTQGSLLPVLSHLRSQEISVFAIYPAARHKNPRVRLVVDTLSEKFDAFTMDPGYSLIKRDA